MFVSWTTLLMVFVSATVVQGGSGKALLPWEIFQCHVVSMTILEFCNAVLFSRIIDAEQPKVF